MPEQPYDRARRLTKQALSGCCREPYTIVGQPPKIRDAAGRYVRTAPDRYRIEPGYHVTVDAGGGFDQDRKTTYWHEPGTLVVRERVGDPLVASITVMLPPDRPAFPWHFPHLFAPPQRWREINAAAGIDATETDGRGRYASELAIRRAADVLQSDVGPLEIAHVELHPLAQAAQIAMSAARFADAALARATVASIGRAAFQPPGAP